MPYELSNLTLPLIVQEIESVLEAYPEHPYQVAFSLHEFWQKLIAQVLSQVPNQFAIAGEPAPVRKPTPRHASHLAERLYLDTVVRGSILHVLRENAERLCALLLEPKHPEPLASR